MRRSSEDVSIAPRLTPDLKLMNSGTGPSIYDSSEKIRGIAYLPSPRVFPWLILVVIMAVGFCLRVRANTYYVTTRSAIFDPGELAIMAGDTVVWINNDNTEHTVTSDDDIFDSGTLEEEDQFSWEFDDPGTYTYFCQFHGHGMSGVVVVSEAGPNDPPATPVNQLPLNNASNQPVAVQLSASAFSDPDGIDFHGGSEWVVFLASNGSIVVDSGTVTGNNLTNYSPAGLLEGTTYDWKVRYEDGRGGWSEYSSPTRFTTLVGFHELGTGLRASYNNVPDFNSPLVVVTNLTIDFSWGHARPNRRITADNFAVRWEGSLLPQFTETYQFQFQYEGAARVWVNNQLVIDDWEGCSLEQTRRGSASLVAGQLTAVRVDYAAAPAGAQAVFRWTSPSLPMEVVPVERLFPRAP